jgi:hypothetical protein
MNSTRTLLVITALAGVVAQVPAQETPNDKVVKFCKDRLGEKVGAGECSDLADEALKQAGARPRTKFKDFPNEGDYVWGTLVYTLETKGNSRKETKVAKIGIQPGDVIQLRDATFKGKNLRGFEIYEANCPHHTAVVVAVDKESKVLTALEQNYNGKSMVLENPYRLTDLKTGWVRVYRPVSE